MNCTKQYYTTPYYSFEFLSILINFSNSMWISLRVTETPTKRWESSKGWKRNRIWQAGTAGTMTPHPGTTHTHTHCHIYAYMICIHIRIVKFSHTNNHSIHAHTNSHVHTCTHTHTHTLIFLFSLLLTFYLFSFVSFLLIIVADQCRSLIAAWWTIVSEAASPHSLPPLTLPPHTVSQPPTKVRAHLYHALPYPMLT
jgi:hypothetical protein